MVATLVASQNWKRKPQRKVGVIVYNLLMLGEYLVWKDGRVGSNSHD
jgi:hypothetical protein